MSSAAKLLLVSPLRLFLRATSSLRENLRRLHGHASLAAQLTSALPPSVVVLGRTTVFGSGDLRFGPDSLLYPDLHLETQYPAVIKLGEGIVISRGVHLVAMAGITIGAGTMIGEYTSIRDANHTRLEGVPIRDGGHTAKPISIGKQVWIGRGVTVLSGVTIGDFATVGANAVVTRDIPAHAIVGGIPAVPLRKGKPE